MTPTRNAGLVVTAAGTLFLSAVVGLGLAGAQTTDGTIAFTRNRVKGGGIDIWTVNPDGTGETRLIRDGNFPAWGPGATSLAFVRITRKGGRDIFTQQVGARKATQLTSDPGDDVAPDWSGDGTQIVWERNNDIWLMNADGSSQHAVFEDGSNSTPTWTPDGRILFSHHPGPAGGDFDIFVVNADGTAPQQLTGEADQDDETRPHSNGQHIVFAKRPGNETDTEIWIMDTAGENEALLFNDASAQENDDHPRWSPDTKIAFECDINNTGDFDADICVMNGDGSGATTVTTVGLDHRPDWG
jgi:TolB protein